MEKGQRKISAGLEEVLTDELKMELAKLPLDGQGEITLVNPKRTGRITVRGYNLPDGSLRPFFDQHGNERAVPITRKMLLDFSKMNDALLYIQVKDHPEYTKSNKPILFIADVNAKAIAEVNKMDLQGEATGIISQMKGDDIFNFARVIGVPIRAGSNESIVKALIYQKAAQDPELVITELKSPDRYLKEVFFAAKSKGVISEKTGTWFFKTEKIGVTLDQALNWIKENMNLVPAILREININITNFSGLKLGVGSSKTNDDPDKQWKELVDLGDQLTEGKIFDEAKDAYEQAKAIKSTAALQKKINAVNKELENAE